MLRIWQCLLGLSVPRGTFRIWTGLRSGCIYWIFYVTFADHYLKHCNFYVTLFATNPFYDVHLKWLSQPLVLVVCPDLIQHISSNYHSSSHILCFLCPMLLWTTSRYGLEYCSISNPVAVYWWLFAESSRVQHWTWSLPLTCIRSNMSHSLWLSPLTQATAPSIAITNTMYHYL